MITLRHPAIRTYFAFLMLVSASLLDSCNMNPTGLNVSPGWEQRSVSVWRNTRPDMMALSPSGKWLYISCETEANMSAPSLVAINMRTGREQYLLLGLQRADALKFAPDGSLWIGEEFPEGLIWRIADPDKLPPEQTVNRTSLSTSTDAVEPFRPAGRFAHEGLSFSKDGHYAYMADEQEAGAIYRLSLAGYHLEVLDTDMHWQPVADPHDARDEASRLNAANFKRLEDMETLPDGRVLLAETSSGRILAMRDTGKGAEISTLLQDKRITHPDNLAWDAKRQWLWITDDSEPSALWAWDGKQAKRIAQHNKAEITGVLPVGNDIYINLQGNKQGPEMTIRLFERPAGQAGME